MDVERIDLSHTISLFWPSKSLRYYNHCSILDESVCSILHKSPKSDFNGLHKADIQYACMKCEWKIHLRAYAQVCITALFCMVSS